MKVKRFKLLRVFQLRTFQIYRPPPYLGEHTDEVLGELGYGDEEIERMKRDGVV